MTFIKNIFFKEVVVLLTDRYTKVYMKSEKLNIEWPAEDWPNKCQWIEVVAHSQTRYTTAATTS